jgi:hypothetical protein
MNRSFGILLCVVSLVGLVSSPALAALNCAMKCQKAEPAVETPFANTAATADSISSHCAEMAAAALASRNLILADGFPAAELVPGEQLSSNVDNGCDCPASCTLSAPAVLTITNADALIEQYPNRNIFIFSLRSVDESFRNRLYRPPIA